MSETGPPVVCVGQVWEEMDPRLKACFRRRVVVLAVRTGGLTQQQERRMPAAVREMFKVPRAYVETVAGAGSSHRRKTSLRVDNMYEHDRGWRLVEEKEPA